MKSVKAGSASASPHRYAGLMAAMSAPSAIRSGSIACASSTVAGPPAFACVRSAASPLARKRHSASVSGANGGSVPASAVTFGLAAVFVAAGVLMLLANVALGGNCTFKAMAAATALTSMVGIPASLVRIPLSMAKGTTQVATSLAAVLPPDAQETLLYRVLNQLDVFGLWGLALNILAVSIVGRVPMRGAAIGVIALWLVWVVAVVLVLGIVAAIIYGLGWLFVGLAIFIPIVLLMFWIGLFPGTFLRKTEATAARYAALIQSRSTAYVEAHHPVILPPDTGGKAARGEERR